MVQIEKKIITTIKKIINGDNYQLLSTSKLGRHECLHFYSLYSYLTSFNLCCSVFFAPHH